jgi:hypothetical protein
MDNPNKDTLVAHHEAAYAVVNYRAGGFAGQTISVEVLREDNVLETSEHKVTENDAAECREAWILSCYAGGYAQRRVDPTTSSDGCDIDEEVARALLETWGWMSREQELRARSHQLVNEHWAEIVAVAEELIRLRTLDDAEVEGIADHVCGDPDAYPELEMYRRLRSLQESRDG